MSDPGCPNCGADEHLIIGHSARDYIQFWSCPNCGHSWNRWPPNHPYYRWAEAFRQRVGG